MDFRKIIEADWDVLRYSANAAGVIRRRATVILGWLKDFFSYNDFGLTFAETSSDDVIGLIATPCGNGRIRLGWRMSGDSLYGELKIDRKSYDQYGVECWCQVWAILVPERGKVFAESEDDGFELRQSGNGRQLENEVFALGMSFYYAILAGPVTKLPAASAS